MLDIARKVPPSSTRALQAWDSAARDRLMGRKRDALFTSTKGLPMLALLFHSTGLEKLISPEGPGPGSDILLYLAE
jgi:hypothetical protein